jgi:hypothetical protein
MMTSTSAKAVQVRLLGDEVSSLSYMVDERLKVDGEPVRFDTADTSTWVPPRALAVRVAHRIPCRRPVRPRPLLVRAQAVWAVELRVSRGAFAVERWRAAFPAAPLARHAHSRGSSARLVGSVSRTSFVLQRFKQKSLHQKHAAKALVGHSPCRPDELSLRRPRLRLRARRIAVPGQQQP